MKGNQKQKRMEPSMKCEQCNAFKRTTPKIGVCRLYPPHLLVFGMEQVNVPGLARNGAQGMRPLTGTGHPEVPNDGWCRQFEQATAAVLAFDPSKLKPQGAANGVNGTDISDK